MFQGTQNKNVLGQASRLGFTLAEVLITLGIIGIVAAMTLPTLIAKHQEKEWVTAFLRVYSLLNNAYRMAQEENGTFENWAGVTIDSSTGKPNRSTASNGVFVYSTMVKPYLKLNDVFINGNNTWGDNNCMADKVYSLTKETFDGNNLSRKIPAVSLPSGECILLGTQYADFIVDVNGTKGPNTLGKDLFFFSFDVIRPEAIRPGYIERGWTDQAKYCDPTSSNGWIAGISCGNWVLRFHNMDYLHLSVDEVKKMWNSNPYSSDW